MDLIKTSDSISKEFKDYEFGISYRCQWGFHFIYKKLNINAQLSEEEMNEFAFFIYKKGGMNLIPGIQRIKELDHKEKENERLKEILNDIADRNEAQRDNIGFLKTRLSAFSQNAQVLVDKFLEGKTIKVDDLDELSKDIRRSARLVDELGND